ncbi:MAG: CRISPR system precrRNA processing endoribonuclease RAMP protein Cas6 [Sciscionella sp.]
MREVLVPVRIRVALTPLLEWTVPPPHTGPAVYAALLRAVSAQQPVLSAVLHDTDGYKPFTITPVLNAHDGAVRTAGESARFEVALLADELTAAVLGGLQGYSRYRIGTTEYRVDEVAVSAAASYAELARGASTTASEWQFRLLTAVGFATAKDEGARRHRPWPDPVRVLGNLAERWDAFAGEVVLPAGLQDAVAEHAEAVAGELRIVEHLVKPARSPQPAVYGRGCTGTVTYRLAVARAVPAEIRRALDALATFADYAGFGDRTAVGMGHVRRC